MILPPEVNSKAGNNLFDEKLDIYRDHTGIRMVKEICELSDWNKEALEEREIKLIEWAKEYWK